MSIESVREYFRTWNMDEKILEFDVSSATVELAARALNCEPQRIAKTMSFMLGEKCVLVVTAGDAKIDNAKYKKLFGKKAKMIRPENVNELTGHEVGGVCPFAIPQGTLVYLDTSLKRFTTVFPACGSSNSAIELSPGELEQYSHAESWIDVCKDWS
ncbi:YbaK/EbsC family protein [Marispirochaeta sp.]|jgi:prolyl-tRNA editing enzyme YbaK/EbsC (Cys-tRNA(Pro) deacylase)|uniref:YbaK/EbsC family protein n=1 Tax=Marispirochaeta sp. TaxID=2038653 RepID=UPI0029C92AE8|nr:YbaK/EbsC family protein [Marispirochaeta sp.]